MVSYGGTAGSLPGLLWLEALCVLCERAERDLERGRKSSHCSPCGILAAALEVRDPSRMQRRSVSELLLA